MEELLNRGYAVTVFDRLFFGDGALQKVRDRIRLISGDMRAMPPAVLENIGTLINLGGLSNDPTAEYNPDANHQMNTVATRTVAAAGGCARRGARDLPATETDYT